MRILVSISAHGLGHLAQTAPVVAALRRLHPALQIVVQTGLPQTLVQAAIGGAASIIPSTSDFGLPMTDPFQVDRAEALAVWSRAGLSADEDASALASYLRQERFDLLLSGISPWPLLAAAKAGVPGFGVGSFAWTDILSSVCRDQAGLRSALAPMLEAYAGATRLFKLQPGLDMAGLNSIAVPKPIARSGLSRRSELLSAIERLRPLEGLDRKIILVGFGGMVPSQMPPFIEDEIPWIVFGPAAWCRNSNIMGWEQLGLPFRDLVASVDLVVSKPGYGMSTELACIGKPSLLVPRGFWPEDRPMVHWLQKHAYCETAESLAAIDKEAIAKCLAQSAGYVASPAQCGGETIVADLIMRDMGYSNDATRRRDLSRREVL